MGPLGDYVVLCPGWHHGVNYPGVKELNEKHQAEFGRPADVMVGPSYAIVQILAAAIEAAGTLDRDAIQDAIAATDMTTVVGPVTSVRMAQASSWFLSSSGRRVSRRWCKEFATTDFVYPAPPFEEKKT